jgi:ADP-ribose pyrophosphatase YjhB (NUDIX family)
MITCEFENGNKASLRHVVIDVLIIKDGKILLTKRAPHLLGGGKYGLIGGYVERGETTAQAAVREAREETGYNTTIEKLLFVNDSPNRPGEDRQNISFVYVASAGEKVSEPDNESSEVTWFDLKNLPHKDEFAFDHYQNIERYLHE